MTMAATDGTSTMRMRSIYVSPAASFPVDAEAQCRLTHSAATTVAEQFSDDGIDDCKQQAGDGDKEPLLLPESTHSLLFIDNVCSLPFWFSMAIVMMSFACLGLTFFNNLQSGTDTNFFNIPANVSGCVRIAQFLCIFVTLLMEEEIPTGLYLLRQIQVQDFAKKFPTKKYRKFVLASMLRILTGYFFLINVFVVLIQANEVIAIFYDVLALQFVQQLDDIAFSLAKMDVLGSHLQRACTASVFRTEFEEQKSKCHKSHFLLKVLYFLNMGALLAGMIAVSYRQSTGYYQCNSITINFGDEVWEPALTLDTTTGQYEDWTLVYSYFNGVYVKDGTHASRPVYKEMRKSDRNSYETVLPAEIRYCKEISSWVFTHDNIRKSDSDDEMGCNWLLRTPKTEEFDLMNVGTTWSIWTGVIGKTEVSIACNECSDNTDCNLNGQCVDGKCKCNKRAGAQYLGLHCETRLSDSCKTVIGEERGETFSVDYYSSTLSPDEDGPIDTIFQEYSRPVYTYVEGSESIGENQTYWLMYTGSRWFGMGFNLTDTGKSIEDFVAFSEEFHAFWKRAYSTRTIYVSDPTQSSTPVGVDWYVIGERGSQFGPFGALYPAQMYNQTGRGYFRCAGSYVPPGRVSF